MGKKGKLTALKRRREGLGKAMVGIKSGKWVEMAWGGLRKVMVMKMCSVQRGWTPDLWSLTQEAEDSSTAEQVLYSLGIFQ